MKCFLYSVRDLDLGFFMPPFIANCDEEAKAMLRDAAEGGSVLAKFPASYHLYRVGSFDAKEKNPLSSDPVCICSCSDLVGRRAEVVAHE